MTPAYKVYTNEYFTIPHLPLNIMRVRDYGQPRHGHDFLELVMVAGGKARHLQCPPLCDTPAYYEIVENDILLVPVGWSHGYDRVNGLEIYNALYRTPILSPSVQNISAPSEIFKLLSGEVTGENSPDCRGLLHKLHLQSTEREIIETGLRAAMREIAVRGAGFEIVARARLAETLVILERIATSRLLGQLKAPIMEMGSPTAEAVAFMEAHFTDAITLEDIAKAARLSPHYFCEVFKATLGTSPRRYLVQLRLAHAKYLLLNTNFSVREVALHSGFTDSTYFAYVFKAATGVAPRQYQKNGRF